MKDENEQKLVDKKRNMAVCDCPIGLPTGPTLATLCGGSQFMLFMGLLEVFIRSQCDLEDPCGRPKVLSLLNTFTFLFEERYHLF